MNRTIDALLSRINTPNRQPAAALWLDLKTHLPQAWGSTKSHHAWDGGYRDHVQEVMNVAMVLYASLSAERTLEFELGSALLVLFLHDCEKPFRHATDKQLRQFAWITQRPGKSDKNFQKQLITHYGFRLSDEEWNGLHYVEGEGSDYLEGRRTQLPLAAFCHVCDTVSARIWFNEPKINHP